VAAFLHFLSFIPVGFLIVRSRRPPVRPAPATLLAVALAVALAGGKFLFHDRHTEVTDLIVQTAGALLGALLAWRRAHGHV
jgi:glycopeptide antibiotics resistance protein